MTNLVQKHWEWQEDRRPMMRHGSVKRPTMYLANMDIKTAFDVARPKHIERMIEDHDVHGWIIAALLRQMAGLEGQDTFVECVEAPRLWQKMAMQILSKVNKYGQRKEWA